MSGTNRHHARRAAVQAIYQWDITGRTETDIESRFIPGGTVETMDSDYFRRLIREVPARVEEIDTMLSIGLDRPIGEIDPVERAVLRVAVWEMKLGNNEVPWRVAIDEAIKLAQLFGSENSFRFVNGVLDKVGRDENGGD